MNAETCMLIGGTVGFLVTLYWVRSRNLREKYAVGWLLVASVLLIVGLFPRSIMMLADASRLSYPAAVLFVALAMIYAFALSVSVTLSRLHKTNRRLIQRVALLEQRLSSVESHDTETANGSEEREYEEIGSAP